MSGQVADDPSHNSPCGTHVYHGHRAKSFYITSGNDPELVEIRARQRTFDGAAYRTAMGNLSYAIVILKLFDARFYRIGVLYTIMSILLFILAYLRSQRSKHDFADNHQPFSAPATVPVPDNNPANSASRSAPIPPSNHNDKTLGRAFKTTGWGVITIFLVVLAVEIALLVLILEL